MNKSLQQQCSVLQSIRVQGKSKPAIKNIRRIYRKPLLCPYFNIKRLKIGSRIAIVRANCKVRSKFAVVKRLIQFTSAYPGTVDTSMIAVVRAHLALVETLPYLHGILQTPQNEYVIEIEASLMTPRSCSVVVSRRRN